MKYYNEDEGRKTVKKYFLVAGEASGDLHASNLVREIKKIQPQAQFAGFGGDLMAAAGVKVIRHYREMDFMGFTEVIMNLRKIFANLDLCKQSIISYHPDTLILIDYPGFNLRIAPFAKALKIKVIYYISPQVWAWKQSRVFKIRQIVDRMLVILPFEKDFYGRFNMNVEFVGHPLMDAIRERRAEPPADDFRSKHNLDLRPIIALLPGSRAQEIKAKLPAMVKMAAEFPGYQFVVAATASQPVDLYRQLVEKAKVKIITGATYEILQNATAALVTSGTATLETALFGVPQVVCYRGSSISYAIAKRLVKVKYISLVNLIMDREVVKELIQEQYTEENLKAELNKILEPGHADHLKSEYLKLEEKLGGVGASARAAKIVASV